MKLIGAGLPRTATMSQKIALEMLGFGPCYHMVNVLVDLDEVPRWRRALEGEPAWDEIFDGFEATVDWPGSFFYRELVDAFADAKVLLSVRDADAWERSMRDTIWGVLYGDTLIRDLSSARERVDPPWRAYMELMAEMWERSGLLSPDGERGPVLSAMDAFNEQVKADLPSDRLLVWTAADGWEPLCDFLEVPVPDAPFPRANDSQQFGERIVDAALQTLQQWRASGAAIETAEFAVPR